MGHTTSSSLQQVQKQSQVQVMAPQLRQSLKILQVPMMELRDTIVEELQMNPTLEELPTTSESIEASIDVQQDTQNKELEFSEYDINKIAELNEDWREYYALESSQRVHSSELEKRRQYLFDSLVSQTSLQEHLMRQAELAECSASELKVMQYVIGSLDDHGFLTVSEDEVVKSTGQALKVVKSVMQMLKTFDPLGIGSSNLQECLLTQLKQAGHKNSLAEKIISKHYQLLLRRRISDIARLTETSTSEVEEALGIIAKLDPAPGRKFSDDINHEIVPDVIVERDGEKWQVILNNDYIPNLGISAVYKQMIMDGNLGSKEKEYLQDKIRSGRFLIQAIEQRQQTLEKIVHALLDKQKDFFENGPSALKPLVMKVIADIVGVHETTISRAVANKYIRTPHGLFELRYFFTSGYTSNEGIEVANTSIKDRISKILESENPMKPLSDQDIAKILGEENMKIARRTVAKYREELGILPTHLRRRYNSD